MVHIVHLWGGPREKAASQNRKVKYRILRTLALSKRLTHCFPVGLTVPGEASHCERESPEKQATAKVPTLRIPDVPF